MANMNSFKLRVVDCHSSYAEHYHKVNVIELSSREMIALSSPRT